MIMIFTDGSSRGNPGPGGWAAIVVGDEKVRELGGREDYTTNNRMELKAAIEGLKASDSSEKITINSDSSYVINGITKWVHGWKKKGWKTLDKKEVVNRDLWEELDGLSSAAAATPGGNISWNYVGGHVGVAGNERCDVIATSYADNDSTKLYSGLLSAYPIKNILDVSASPEASVKKSSTKSRSSAVAYSYISKVGGVITIDNTWKECEARVKGKTGARYKKALNKTEESEIIADFRKN